MTKTDKNCVADIEFELQWKSQNGTHSDSYFSKGVNFYLDFLPKGLFDKLLDRDVGDSVEHTFNAGEVIAKPDPTKLFRININQFDTQFMPDALVYPRQGRFYPRGILLNVPNVFRANKVPFRCAEVNDSDILVDFNHPLAGTELLVKATIRDIRSKRSGAGGMSNDWMEIITTGPGMQARWNGQSTDFLSDDPFARLDETPDGSFYEKPRFVNHLDETAIGNISGLYEKLLHPGSKVLDLMSSWKSHLPPGLELGTVTGLGMNHEELKANERLTDMVIHDLNEEAGLPFEDESFDAVICTVSVEYLTQPMAVFKDVGRILKKGGCFITTFSNRWFPPKVINVWKQIEEFERMGLVAEYFLRSEKFDNINTYSLRGLPRPTEDKYYGELTVSDPVYGVWAYRY